MGQENANFNGNFPNLNFANLGLANLTMANLNSLGLLQSLSNLGNLQGLTNANVAAALAAGTSENANGNALGNSCFYRSLQLRLMSFQIFQRVWLVAHCI